MCFLMKRGALMRNKLIVLLVLALLAWCGNVFFASMDVKSIAIDKVMPLSFASYEGVDLKLKKYVYEILGSSNVLSRRYTGPNGFQCDVSVVASFSDRLVIHPPEVCMHGGGADVMGKKVVRLCNTDFNYMVAKYSDSLKYYVYYFYGIGNKKRYVDYYRFQIASFINKVMRRSEVAYLFRIVVYEGQEKGLEDFVCALMSNMDVERATN